MRVLYEDFKCKLCGSHNIVRYGKLRGIQRWWCKDCHHKFADNDALPNMKTPAEQVSSALNMYYEGMSLQAIRRQLQQEHNSSVSDSNIYSWIVRFTNEAIKEADKYKPNVGDVWIADETVLKIEGKNRWFFDIIDSKTRFLLASHISNARNRQDVKTLMEKAAAKAGKTPKYVITDKLSAYLDGIELAFGANTKHIQSKPFTVVNSTNLIERFHGTLKSRTKIMRGLKRLDSARLFTEGWLVHYNFFRPHETIGKTPAEKAEINFPFKNWKVIVCRPQVAVSVKTVHVPLHVVSKAMKSRLPSLNLPRQTTTKARQPITMVSQKRGRQYYTQTPTGGTLISRFLPKGAKLVRRK